MMRRFFITGLPDQGKTLCNPPPACLKYILAQVQPPLQPSLRTPAGALVQKKRSASERDTIQPTKEVTSMAMHRKLNSLFHLDSGCLGIFYELWVTCV